MTKHTSTEKKARTKNVKPTVVFPAPVQKSELENVRVDGADYLKHLITDRENWEGNEKRRSTDVLYDLLAKCVRLHGMMCEATVEGERIRDDVELYIKNAKLKFDGATHSLVKIARVVFANDRRSASAYGLAMQIAVSAGIIADQLPDYLRDNGGIEAIRKSAKKPGSGESSEMKAEKVWAQIKTRCLAVAESDELSKNVDLAKVGVRVVLLATQQVGGKFEIHEVVRANGIVNSAFGSMSADIAKIATVHEAAPSPSAPEMQEARRVIRESVAA